MAEGSLNTDQSSHGASTPDIEHSSGFAASSDASLKLKPKTDVDDVRSDNEPVNEKVASEGAPAPVRAVSGWRWALMVSSILSSTFLYALDNTIVADVEGKIVDTFGQIQKLSWLPIAFLVVCVATNSIWGKIYTHLNAKWLYLLCILLFEVGSALCGAAPTLNALIGGRVLAGLGGAGLYIGVMTLVAVNTTEHERPTYIGLTGLTWGLGTVLGPIIGGAFAVSSVGWRYAFYINLFVAAAAAPVYLFIIPPFDPQPGVPYKERLSQLDYLGTLLMVGACVSGVMAINFGGVIYPWDSAQTIACFVVSGVLFIVFGFQQAYCIFTTEENRIFPCQFLKQRILIILFMQTAAATTIFFVPIYFIPLFYQFVRGLSTIDSGVRLLPLVCLLVFAVIINGALMSKYGYYMPWYLAGGCLALIGSALMYTVKLDTSDAHIYGYTVLLGLGGGMYAQASFAVAQAKSKPQEIPLAIGFISLAQIGGATIALAIANAVFLNNATNGILAIIPTASRSVVQGAVSGANSAFFKSLDPSVKTAVLEAVTHAVSRIYILAITGAALSIVLALFMPREKLFMAAGVAA
ncbi:major facilitator superfamily domain-containing protein [Xylogone sp. PMI_703]|nr:major facilitator superfamily domain-containing protein [Xylogone sp. PMI_703]